MRHPRPYVRVLVVATAVAACLATTGAVALARTQPSHPQLTHPQLTHAQLTHAQLTHAQLANAQLADAENHPDKDAEKQNITVVLTALQVVFNEHRVDQIDQFFTEDFTQHSPLVSPDDAGRDGLKRWLTGIVTAIPDLTYLPGDPMADDDRVMVFADVHGTIQADLPAYGIKGTGQRLRVSTAHVFRVAHGKIAEHWEVVDTGPLLQLALASTTH
jgi:predicted SnoaL-like aldol condensation-catalyzing enzyme